MKEHRDCLPFWAETLNGVPKGGTSGDVLTKKSSEDYDYVWAPSSGGGEADNGLPEGGVSGQALIKTGLDDYEAEWQDIRTVPNGGTTGQVLTKTSNVSGEYSWQSISGGEGDELPPHTVADEGKYLMVDGANQLIWDEPDVLPSIDPINDIGKVLTVDTFGEATWDDVDIPEPYPTPSANKRFLYFDNVYSWKILETRWQATNKVNNAELVDNPLPLDGGQTVSREWTPTTGPFVQNAKAMIRVKVRALIGLQYSAVEKLIMLTPGVAYTTAYEIEDVDLGTLKVIDPTLFDKNFCNVRATFTYDDVSGKVTTDIHIAPIGTMMNTYDISSVELTITEYTLQAWIGD